MHSEDFVLNTRARADGGMKEDPVPAASRVVTTTAAILIGGGITGIGAGVAHATDAAGPCAKEHYEWSGNHLLASFDPEFDTGVSIPAAAPGEQLTVLEATWVARNSYPEQDPEHTRAIDDQQHESFALVIGGTQIGRLTPDLPDTLDEGAPTEWFSGDQVGSFGGGSISGGAIVLKHAYLFGFDESANSLEPQLVSIDVERCAAPPETTTTCTCPPTSTDAPTTTTEVPTTEPVATIAETVPTAPPDTEYYLPPPPVIPETTQPVLVATGRTSGWIVGAGGASLLSGMTLLRVRRRGQPR